MNTILSSVFPSDPIVGEEDAADLRLDSGTALRERIIQLVMGQLLTLSKHKFASNVVEKCIEFGTPAQRTTIREQLTTTGPDGTNPLQQMMRDQFGNYVIRKFLLFFFLF